MTLTQHEFRKIFTDVRLRDRFIRAMGILIDTYSLKHADTGFCPLCQVARDAHEVCQPGEHISECEFCPWMYFTGQDCDDYFEDWSVGDNKAFDSDGDRITISCARSRTKQYREWAKHRLPMLRKWRKAVKAWK